MKEIEKWVERAEKDLTAAKINLRQNLFEVAAFLAQQAIEKSNESSLFKEIQQN